MNSINSIGSEQIAQPSGPPRWMMSFADLMSVILTFFVLLFSMSTTPKSTALHDNDLTQTEQAAYSVKKAGHWNNIKAARTDQDLSTNYLADIIKNRIAAYPELSKAELNVDGDKLVISIRANEFKDSYASNLAQLLKSLNNKAAIYTASLDESYAVMQKLQQNGLDKPISFFESADMAGKIDIVIYP